MISKLPDGTIITTLPDGRVIRTSSDGTTEITTGIEAGLGDPYIDGLFSRGADLDVLEAGDLKNVSEFDINKDNIELASIVSGLSGWGLVSRRSPNGKSILDRDAFRELDREMNRRRFLHWREGRFVTYDDEIDTVFDKKKLH